MAERAGIEAGLLDQAPVAVAISDRDGNVVYWNKGAETLYGWSRTVVLGRRLSDLIGMPSSPDGVRELMAAAAGDEPSEVELLVRARGGAEFPVRARSAPVRDAAGNCVATITISLAAKEAAHSGRPRYGRGSEIGRRIAEARRDVGLTQGELAEKVGVTRRSIQGYESGAVVPYKHLDTLGAALDRRTTWFLGQEQIAAAPPPAPDVPESAGALREFLREELLAIFGEVGLVSSPPVAVAR